MAIIFQFIYSFFATTGFAIYFGAPVNSVIPSGIAGGLSWSLYYIVFLTLHNKILATFMGAFLVGALGEILATKYKKPATVFITPGIVSLVPGAGMYYTMSYLVGKDYNNAIATGTETFFVAAAIAIGVIISTMFSRLIKSFKKYT
ncbi:MAG: threonine/serine exporter family protein [Tissierella sp.]|uniref:threonine/serine exporter family protein n=1 Tax=Tissierella sp. TaxID=41274 RepID=UPI003F9ADEAB